MMAAAKKKKVENHDIVTIDDGAMQMDEVTDGDATEMLEEMPEAIVAPEPTIHLDVSLSIQNVVALYEKIKRSYAAFNTLEINASGVASIDTATLQLLVALKKDAVKQQKEVIFTEPTPRFLESAGLLGLLEILELDT